MINPDDRIIIEGQKSGSLHICDSVVNIHFVNHEDLQKTTTVRITAGHIKKALEKYIEKNFTTSFSVRLHEHD